MRCEQLLRALQLQTRQHLFGAVPFLGGHLRTAAGKSRLPPCDQREPCDHADHHQAHRPCAQQAAPVGEPLRIRPARFLRGPRGLPLRQRPKLCGEL